MVRVFLCDDVAAFRALVRAVLEEGACRVVGEAADGPAAVSGVAAARPDVVLLDLDMPGGDGLAAIPALREAAPAARIVVLSSFPARRMRRRTLDAGAHEYLEKREPLSVVREAVIGAERCAPTA